MVAETKRVFIQEPNCLVGVRSELVQGGLFEVFENGRIFRVNENEVVECTQSRSGRNAGRKSGGGYRMVSRTNDGIQKHYLVHRLIAEAFIPNPENKPQINHKDGNSTNNYIDNLEWVTAQENIIHAYETGLIDPFVNGKPCTVCENKTRAEDGVCTDCKAIRLTVKLAEEHKLRIIASASHYEVSNLTKRQEEVITLRKKGLTYEEIGKSLGVTRQAVEQHIRNAEERMETFTIDEHTKELSIDGHTRFTIRQARNYAGLTQAEMAKRLSMSTNSYNEYENGKHYFRVDKAYLFSKIVGMDTSTVIFFKEELHLECSD